jgi:hypothetical protein
MIFKEDWKLDDVVEPSDANRWEGNTKEIYEGLQDAEKQISMAAEAGANNTHDIALLAFQLELKGLTDSEELTNVCVDTITSETSVIINSGKYAEGKVYI